LARIIPISLIGAGWGTIVLGNDFRLGKAKEDPGARV